MKEIDERVTEYIAEKGIVTKTELCNDFNKAWSTIEEALIRLENEKQVKRIYENRKHRGRPRVFFIIPENK